MTQTHLRGNGQHPKQPSLSPPGLLSRKLPQGPPVSRLRVMGFTWLFPMPEKWAGLGFPPSLFPTGFQELACQWGVGVGTCPYPTPQPLRVVDVCIYDLTLLSLGMPGTGARS